MNWNYSQPVKIIFGNGRISELKNLLSEYKNPILVSDPYFLKNGLIDKIKSIADVKAVFTDISPNPDVVEVNMCSKLLREEEADILIALGGGSALDLAKAASIAVEDITLYHNGEKAVPNSAIPIIAVPTTAGTGSEVTCVSVLTNRETGRKSPIVSESFYPKAALIDPELLHSLPAA